jgi:IclR family transcriptional regulator, pca regulon regulatory protein
MSIHFSSRNASSRRPFVYVVRVQTSRIISINLTVGTRLPAALTAMGRVLLAALPCAGGVVATPYTKSTVKTI